MTDTKLLAESLLENSIREQMLIESATQDSASWGELLLPLLEKIYSETLVSQIASCSKLSSPVGRVSAVFSPMGGYQSSIDNLISIVASGSNISINQFYETSRVIAIQGAYNLTSVTASGNGGYTLSVSGSSIVNNVSVLYSEIKTFQIQVPTNSVPVSALNATGLTAADGPYTTQTVTATFALVNNWVPTTNLNSTPNYTVVTDSTGIIPASGAPLLMSIANRTAIKKYFSKYSGDFSGLITALNHSNYGSDDSNANIKYIDILTRSVLIETKTRKIASKLTHEKIEDMKRIYGKDYKKLLAKIVGQEIATEIDMEIISYMKEIASPAPDINLTYTLGMANSTVSEMSADIIVNINLCVEQIIKNTKRNRTMFVIADSTTASILSGNPLFVKTEENKNNPYHLGKLSQHDLYVDMYSDDHYILVGYRYKDSELGDAAILYASYAHFMKEFEDDGDQLQSAIVTFNRYGYTVHPQDSGNGALGSSDFMKIFHVSYNGPSPLEPAQVFDVPSLTKSIINFI